MNEVEWLSCGDPAMMLEFLRGKTSDRKLRLFACACCHRMSDVLKPLSMEAIRIAERFADQMATEEVLAEIRARVLRACPLYPGEPVYDPTYWACTRLIEESLRKCLGYCESLVAERIPYSAADYHSRSEVIRQFERVQHADLLREIIGNPFRTTSFPQEQLDWRDSTIVKLAKAIYDDQALDRLGILADALEEAGCTNADILKHCRSKGPHARGCWVVDLVVDRN